MQDNPNTENPPLDTEGWELALEPYKGNPSAALSLGFNLYVVISYIAVEPLKIQEAIDGLDRGLKVLFPFSEFHEVSHELWRKVIEGRITVEEEQTLRSLGIKF